VYNQFVVRVPGAARDDLRAHLASRKIGTEIYYPVPLHQQACFKDVGSKPGSLPESERAAKETLALPIFPELSAQEQTLVVDEIARFMKPAITPLPKSGLASIKRPAVQRRGVAG